jgi:hypothetical protein
MAAATAGAGVHVHGGWAYAQPQRGQQQQQLMSGGRACSPPPVTPFFIIIIIILSSLSYLLSISYIYICIYCILMNSNCKKKEKKPRVQKVPRVSFDTA